MATDKKTRVANVVVFVLSVILVALLCFAVTSKAGDTKEIPLTDWSQSSLTRRAMRYVLIDNILCLEVASGRSLSISCDWGNAQKDKKDKLIKSIGESKVREEEEKTMEEIEKTFRMLN